MAKKFRDLVNETMTVEEQAEMRAETAQLISEMSLHELRAARAISQTTLAEILGVGQASVSKLERRTDMYIPPRGMIAAMGGELRIVAHFPDGDVQINQFADLRYESISAPKRRVAERRGARQDRGR